MSDYTELLARSLTGLLNCDPPQDPWHGKMVDEGDGKYGVYPGAFDARVRENGRDWPQTALTMIGLKRLQNFEWTIRHTHAQEIPGDIVETGVWRGGACMLARGVLRELNDVTRSVIVCDSFMGLPPPPPGSPFPQDLHHVATMLAVGLEEVRANFERYGLLDAQITFIKGWFCDTLPSLAGPFSVIRLDGDMYESTRIALEALYPKLSPGGICIIDDYNSVPGCKMAVDEFRAALLVAPENVHDIDGCGVWWQKSRNARGISLGEKIQCPSKTNRSSM